MRDVTSDHGLVEVPYCRAENRRMSRLLACRDCFQVAARGERATVAAQHDRAYLVVGRRAGQSGQYPVVHLAVDRIEFVRPVKGYPGDRAVGLVADGIGRGSLRHPSESPMSLVSRYSVMPWVPPSRPRPL
jgi:hypothetical protein